MVSEKYVLLYANTYDLDAIVLRLPNVYGPRAAIHSPAFTFINYFIGQGLQGISAPVYSPGCQLRNLLYVGDAVTAILLAMKRTPSVLELTIYVETNIFQSVTLAKRSAAISVAELSCSTGRMGARVSMLATLFFLARNLIVLLDGCQRSS